MGLYIAIDVGGTSTRAGLYDRDRRLRADATAPPANPAAYGLSSCQATLAELVSRLLAQADGPVHGLAAAVSGAFDDATRHAIAEGLAIECPGARTLVSDDLRPILYANAGTTAAVLVIAGTGSSVLAQANGGQWVMVGGYGGVMSDDGGAYRLAVEALRAAVRSVDGLTAPTLLTDVLPRAVGRSSIEDLPSWAEGATKQAVAALATVVIDAAQCGDEAAVAVVRGQADALAAQVVAAHSRLRLPAHANF